MKKSSALSLIRVLLTGFFRSGSNNPLNLRGLLCFDRPVGDVKIDQVNKKHHSKNTSA